MGAVAQQANTPSLVPAFHEGPSSSSLSTEMSYLPPVFVPMRCPTTEEHGYSLNIDICFCYGRTREISKSRICPAYFKYVYVLIQYMVYIMYVDILSICKSQLQSSIDKLIIWSQILGSFQLIWELVIILILCFVDQNLRILYISLVPSFKTLHFITM